MHVQISEVYWRYQKRSMFILRGKREWNITVSMDYLKREITAIPLSGKRISNFFIMCYIFLANQNISYRVNVSEIINIRTHTKTTIMQLLTLLSYVLYWLGVIFKYHGYPWITSLFHTQWYVYASLTSRCFDESISFESRLNAEM